MAEQYVNKEKNIQILWLKTSIFQVFRKIVKLEQLTHCFTIFFKFLKKRNALIRTYTTPVPCFRRKFKNVQQDIVKQPVNCINKTKRDIKKKFNDPQKKYPAFSEFHLEKLDRFVGDSCQKLGIVKDVLVYFKKYYVNAFVFNGSLLRQVWIWLQQCQHNLGYQQFADILNNLSFDKIFVKYCCKKLKEVSAGL